MNILEFFKINLLFIAGILSQDLANHIAVYENQSNFSLLCPNRFENGDLQSIGYSYNTNNDELILIANSSGIIENEKHRYSLEKSNENWKVTFTKTTEAYDDNMYFNCKSERKNLRGTFVLLCKFLFCKKFIFYSKYFKINFSKFYLSWRRKD